MWLPSFLRAAAGGNVDVIKVLIKAIANLTAPEESLLNTGNWLW
jgi:hypothetical protein